MTDLRRPRSRRSVLSAIPFLVLFASVSGAEHAGASPEAESTDAAVAAPHTAEGPGALFPSPQSAALDALAWCEHRAREGPASLRRVRGGAIRAVPGGFTYDEPRVAPRSRRDTVRYALRPVDVAHFSHYPATAVDPSPRARRAIEARARSFVERRDPIGRPLFYMTPDRVVRVEEGAVSSPRRVARLERAAARVARRTAPAGEDATPASRIAHSAPLGEPR